MRGENLPLRLRFRWNLSHKELSRVFIRRENLMRLAAPQLKRADLRATYRARASARFARCVVNLFLITYCPDSLQERERKTERENRECDV